MESGYLSFLRQAVMRPHASSQTEEGAFFLAKDATVTDELKTHVSLQLDGWSVPNSKAPVK